MYYKYTLFTNQNLAVQRNIICSMNSRLLDACLSENLIEQNMSVVTHEERLIYRTCCTCELVPFHNFI